MNKYPSAADLFSDELLTAAPKLRPGSKILFVAEAPGEEEVQRNEPLVGPSGRFLGWLCRKAGFELEEHSKTNLIHERPPSNDFKYFCTKGKPYSKYPYKAVEKGYYLKEEYLPQIDRLWDEIKLCRPNLVVALGNKALWALCGETGITKLRGSVRYATDGKTKVLPTLHPAAVLRRYRDHIISIADLAKAKREAEYPDIRVENTEIWLRPNLGDLHKFEQMYMPEPTTVACDIETALGKHITCIGFAPSESAAIVVPFANKQQPHYNYWSSPQAERLAWKWVEKQLARHRLIFQFGTYDVQHLLRAGIRRINYAEDTMLMHHALYPELDKSLKMLGSLYADRPAWKADRMRGDETQKRED